MNSDAIKVKLRRFQTTDAEALRELFNETVRHVNKRDYTATQIAAWAPGDYDRQAWLEHFGFRLVREQQVVVRGERLTNYLMEKLTHAGE